MSQSTASNLNLDNLDVVFVLDKSGSMGYEYKKGQSRWKAAEETATALAKEMSEHDDDGITVVPFNNSFSVEDGVTGDTVGTIFKKHSPDGGTDLGPPLRAVIDKFVPAKKTGILGGIGKLFGGSTTESATPKGKSVCVVVVTDGAANDKEAVVQTIVDATKRINSRSELGILFIQVGNDPAAESFLKQIDSELGPAGAAHDIVARCKLEDVEDKSTVELLSLAFTG